MYVCIFLFSITNRQSFQLVKYLSLYKYPLLYCMMLQYYGSLCASIRFLGLEIKGSWLFVTTVFVHVFIPPNRISYHGMSLWFMGASIRFLGLEAFQGSVSHFRCVLVSPSTERAEVWQTGGDWTLPEAFVWRTSSVAWKCCCCCCCCFSQSPVPSFAPDKQFFKLLQMLHYRDSIRVSKDSLALLLLFLLLCALLIFLLLWIFILFACFYLLHPLLVSSSVLYLFPILRLPSFTIAETSESQGFSVFFFLSVQGCSLGICHTSESQSLSVFLLSLQRLQFGHFVSSAIMEIYN